MYSNQPLRFEVFNSLFADFRQLFMFTNTTGNVEYLRVFRNYNPVSRAGAIENIWSRVLVRVH